MNGKFKLMVDLNEYVKNEDLFDDIHQHKNTKKGKAPQGYSEQFKSKASLKNIIQYVNGSYFGDSDVFAQYQFGLDHYGGRDLTAVSQ